jgi:hypothetical protein
MSPVRQARVPLIALALSAAFLLSACDPGPSDPVAEPSASETPSPTPTPSEAPRAPAVGELVITPDGMGTLVIGQAPPTDAAQVMIEEDPAHCADVNTGFGAGVEPGDPEAIRWVPIDAYETAGHAPWAVNVLDGLLHRIDVFDSSIPTDLGIRIGDPAATALTAYSAFPVTDEEITQVIAVPGEHGVLHIELASTTGEWGTYWGAQAGTVVYIRAVTLDSGVFSVAASENIAGGCL